MAIHLDLTMGCFHTHTNKANRWTAIPHPPDDTSRSELWPSAPSQQHPLHLWVQEGRGRGGGGGRRGRGRGENRQRRVGKGERMHTYQGGHER